MTVNYCIDAVGPSGASQTMHVFGTATRHFPAITKKAAVTHGERFQTMRHAQRQVEKQKETSSVKQAQVHHEPNIFEDVLEVGNDVLVHRKDEGWAGPFQIVSLTDADARVRDQKGWTSLFERSMIQKHNLPYPDEHTFWDDWRKAVQGPADIVISDEKVSLPDEFSSDDPVVAEPFVVSCEEDVIISHPDNPNGIDEFLACETKVFPPSPENVARFYASCRAELDGLMEANVFEVMKRSDAVKKGTRIFNSRFVDAVKNPNTSRA